MNSEAVTDRDFSFCKIEWKIKNYFAVTSVENWVITSPAFSLNGKICTKWRFFLKVNYVDEKHIICAYLVKMKCDPVQEPICVTWNLFFPSNVDKMPHEVEFEFEKRMSAEIELCGADELQNIMQFCAQDTVIIRSMIFVSRKDSQLHKTCKDVNLKSLSQDLRLLFRVDKNYDQQFLIGKFTAKAHKAILHFRNSVLKTEINRREEVITLPQLDAEAAEKVFGYLYTGNLDYVLRKPSYSLLQCINYFGIEELQKYYEPDELELCTDFRMEEYKFEYTISVKEIINSNIITSRSSITKNSRPIEPVLILHLDSMELNEKNDYMTVFIENIEKILSKISYVEMSIMDVNGKIHHLERKRCTGSSPKIAFENFLPKDILKDCAFTYDGKLHLWCKFCTFIRCSRILSICRNKFHSNIYIDPETHYEMLSDHMAALLDTGMYSDCNLTCNGDKFRVHSYILSARSYVFRNLFKTKAMKEQVYTFDVSAVKSNVLRAVLCYMYSGKLLISEIDKISQIYEVAGMFYVLPLIYACSNILQDNLKSIDHIRILALAQKCKDFKLRALLQKFISSKTQDCPEDVA